MRNWSRESCKSCETSAVRLCRSSLYASRRVDLGDLATQIKFDCRRFWMCARSRSRTWWRSLGSLSMGTVNQYKLITWLDPLGTKTSSINHASTFQAAAPLQPSAPTSQERRREGGNMCKRVCVFMWVGAYILGGYWECGTSSSTCKNTKVTSTMVTRDCLLIPDHKRTQFVCHRSLPQRCTQSDSLNSYFMDRFISELSFFLSRAHCLVSFSVPVFSCSYSSSPSPLSYSSLPNHDPTQ